MMVSKRQVVGLGEVLWDVFDDRKLFGGAPANFACHAASLGAEAHILSAVGHDALGDEALAWLQQRSLSVLGIERDRLHPTGSVRIQLDAAGRPTYTFASDVAWDHLECSSYWLQVANQTDAVCFGTLAQRSETSRRAISQFLERVPKGCLRVFDVNLRQSFYSPEIIRDSLSRSDVLKLNDEELPILADALGIDVGGAGSRGPISKPSTTDAETLKILDAIATAYDLNCVALTLGSEGSLVWLEGDWDRQPTPSNVEVMDTVGAGDAFSAALIMGLLHGDPLPALHRRAARIAAYVCTQRGAVPPLPSELID
ncbi:MAG: carbohydrate kinase [Planctomycetota bacterium]